MTMPGAALDGCLRPVPTGIDEAIELYRVDLERLAQRADCSAREAADAQRAARFHFERDRRRYLAARYALRQVLASTLSLEPGAIRLAEDANGKPCLAGAAARACHFNLSHSGGLALIALSRAAPVGVDLELVGGKEPDEGLLASCLSAAERTQWPAIAPAARPRAFLDLWTRKEAMLKAVGIGLRVEPCDVDAGFGLQGATLRVGADSVRVWTIDTGDAEVAAAVARVIA